MAEEQVVPAAPAEPAPAAPAVPAEPAKPEAPPQPQPTVAPEIADVRARLENLERDLAQARHDVTYFKTVAEQATGRPPARTEPEIDEKPPVTDEDMVLKPVESQIKLNRWLREKDDKERKKQDKAREDQEARKDYETGFAQAKQTTKGLYDGIEQDVQRKVADAYFAGAISRDQLRDPMVWEITAIAERRMRGEKILDKYFSNPTPQAVQAVHTEVPGPQTPPKAEVSLTAEEEEIIKVGRVSREAYLAAKKKNLEEGM